MNYTLSHIQNDFPNIWQLLQQVPPDLWRVFLPASLDDLPLWEANILLFEQRAADREQVMAIQRLCGFELEPNASLGEMKALARLQGIKKDDLLKRYRANNNPAE